MKSSVKKGLRISKTLLFSLLAQRATNFLKKPRLVFNIVDDALAKLKRYDSANELALDVREQFNSLFRMVQVAVKGEYKGISKKNIVLSIATIVYFVTPVDLLPDVLPMLGLVDDVSLLVWLTHSIRQEMEDFELWEQGQKMTIDITDYEELSPPGQPSNKDEMEG